MNKPITYRDAGVDIDKANRFIEVIKKITRRGPRAGVIAGIGGFSGLYSLDVSQYKNPVLAASTDGVGTKIKVACMMNRHDTIGIDLVAMCVNDILVQGARPLFFLDYFSTGVLIPEQGEQIIRGIVEGCKLASCALIGGETAEMPGMYSEGDYDLAGFVVGIVDNSKIVDGSEIAVGDRVVGVGSTGLHSNGYSLARKVCFEKLNLRINDRVDMLGRTIGEELLEPTKIYYNVVSLVLRDFPVHGIAHITGGGIVDNLSRILPSTCCAEIQEGSWEVLPIFKFIEQEGGVSRREMRKTFNNGIGLIFVVPPKVSTSLLEFLVAMGEKAYLIGSITERKKGAHQVVWV